MAEVPARSVTRRAVLAGAAGATVAAGAAVATGAAGVGTTGARSGTGASAPPAGAAPRAPGGPFTLGVASGDPAPDGFVLWTRLAPTPLAEDGRGGMPASPVDVQWELATDERFGQIERRGQVSAVPESAHSIHVELAGLRPGREYFYRFRAAGHLSPAGRTRTAPEPTALGPALTMCFASCSQYEHGWFTAYRRLAAEHPDVVVHLDR